MLYVYWAISTACALVAGGCALKLRSTLRLERDEHELALTSARIRSRNLETAIWATYGEHALPKLRAVIEAAPWGARNTSSLHSNGRYIGTAWEDGWRLATPAERAKHERAERAFHDALGGS